MKWKSSRMNKKTVRLEKIFMKEDVCKMQIRKKIKNHFRVIVILMLLIGMLPAGINGLPGQATVVEAATNIKLNKTKATLIKGQAVQLKLNGARGKTAWSSSNKKIAVVNARGCLLYTSDAADE